MDKYVMVIDTETANNVEQPLPYDFGWAVLDTETGEIVRKFSYVCAEIFLDKELMDQLNSIVTTNGLTSDFHVVSSDKSGLISYVYDDYVGVGQRRKLRGKVIQLVLAEVGDF